jgi:hypothetical protein
MRLTRIVVFMVNRSKVEVGFQTAETAFYVPDTVVDNPNQFLVVIRFLQTYIQVTNATFWLHRDIEKKIIWG